MDKLFHLGVQWHLSLSNCVLHTLLCLFQDYHYKEWYECRYVDFLNNVVHFSYIHSNLQACGANAILVSVEFYCYIFTIYRYLLCFRVARKYSVNFKNIRNCASNAQLSTILLNSILLRRPLFHSRLVYTII